MRQQLPIADAVRVRGRYGDLLELVACPFCEKRHIHGAGNHGSPAGSFDGGRVPHCSDRRKWDRQYYVRESAAREVAA